MKENLHDMPAEVAESFATVSRIEGLKIHVNFITLSN
jgi:hypothetical protein